MDTPNQTLVALFASRDDAYSGITGLLHAGFAPQQVGFLDPTDVLFGTEAGRAAGPYVMKVKTGRVLVSADVAGLEGGTKAAEVLLERNALAVASLAMRVFTRSSAIPCGQLSAPPPDPDRRDDPGLSPGTRRHCPDYPEICLATAA